MSWIKMPTTADRTCPGIREFTRPTVRYVKCHVCGGNVEVWSDETEGVCINCGSKWVKPNDNASCLDYCEYAEQCRKIISNRQQ
jgi:DNA-directed RNA polymerase subunit RPC12/RpoP